MLILVTYDVNTETKEGRKRLHDVAKKCVAHGQRLQNSVFECNLDVAQFRKFEAEITKIIDVETDSLRFYNLGNNYDNRLTYIGIKPCIPVDKGVLIV
ncbi:CRISPR-associated endoribonuclease Cas2 [Clostridia bacterium]|nr:CRISPR-associated endoribonuclease Cas2 [Clostridia bacterium]